MVKNITDAAIRQLQEELDQLEAQGRRELKDPSTHAVGLLRVDLIKECRRRLFFIATMMRHGTHDR
jgi:hypothetical protein